MADFASGLLFFVVGLSVVWFAAHYSPGTTARMGPGYFPRLLGGVLALLCLAVFVYGLKLQFPVWPPFITG